MLTRFLRITKLFGNSRGVRHSQLLARAPQCWPSLSSYQSMSTEAATPTTMADSTPLFLRLVAASHSISYKAGEIIRNVMTGGDLGIVSKVGRY